MIAYRDAASSDAAMMAGLARRTFVETFGHLYGPTDLAAFLAGHSEAAWTAELAEPGLKVRIAEEEGEAVGFAKVGRLKLPATPLGKPAELRSLYILKPWQGAGVAPVLMDWAIDEARKAGADEMFLSVYVDNHRARRFYERYGFAYVGPYAFMVGSQADEDHILRLDLKERR